MSNKVLTRRELRQQKRQRTVNYRNIKKGTAVVGTALVAVSVAAPLLNANEVEAVEGKTTATTSNVNKKAFINEISNEIKPLAEKHDLYASIMIAQAIVESDWGQNEFAKAPYYNLFGLEGQYQGQSAMLDKQDAETGKTEKKELKKYGSYKEAIEDYIEILKTTSEDGEENYFSGTWRSNAKDYQTAAKALEGRFNDDQEYVQKLIAAIQEHDLTSYDATEPVTPPVAQPATETKALAETATPEQTTQYTVQSGDTVGSIAAQFGIAVNDFVNWNGIDGTNIYAGQTVIVGNGPAVQAEVPVANETPAPVTPEIVEPVVNNTPSSDVTPAPAADDSTLPETTPVVPDQSVEQDPVPTPAPEQPQKTEEQPAQPVQPAPEQNTQEQTPAPEQPATTPEQPATTPEQPAANEQQQTAPEQSTSTEATRGQQVVNEAAKYIGTDYVWGGKDPSGFDCSGLTQYVYKQVTGKDIGVWTVAQESSGTQISVSQAQEGDLLFWGDQGATTHVAISTGGDSYIHAPQPGEQVKYGSTQYYAPDFGVRVY